MGQGRGGTWGERIDASEGKGARFLAGALVWQRPGGRWRRCRAIG